LSELGSTLPIVFVTGYADISATVRASVPLSPAVVLGGREQSFDLGLRQIFAGAQVSIWLCSQSDQDREAAQYVAKGQ